MHPRSQPFQSFRVSNIPTRGCFALHATIPSNRNRPMPLQSKLIPTSRCYSSPAVFPVSQPLGLLTGKKAIITGSSRGIGKAIAERFAAEGARCVLVGRDEGTLSNVRKGLAIVNGEGGSEGSEHVVRVGDVGDGQFWRGLRGEKPVDILVNAAGITHYSPLFATTEELLQKLLYTNLMGTMLGCKTIGKAMLGNANGGCIINVASLLGLKGGKGSAGYVASKAGVIGFTRALAAEVGKFKIRANVIVPGYIETDMTAAMTPEARSEALDAIPLKRFGEASEIADAAVFLATNKYANNCVLNLDGGLSAM